MNVLSLFSGIGGLELGLERAGMRVVGQVERDPFCLAVLARHWPQVPRHDEVTTTVAWWTGQEGRPHVDLVAGGFPCQPASTAGRRLGTADQRWLWPAMAEVIAALRPAWVLAENVPGLRTRGLAVVLTDLDRLGYTARAGVVGACEVGAPHPRTRLFTLAHTAGQGRCPWRAERAGAGTAQSQQQDRTQPARSGWWTHEPPVDRVAYGIPARVDRARALGNAVVPQVAEHIGRLILASGDHHDRRP